MNKQLKNAAKRAAVSIAQQKLQQHIAATDAKSKAQTFKGMQGNSIVDELVPPTQVFTELKTGGGLLVGNWRDAWKWLSNWAFTLIAYVATFGVRKKCSAFYPKPHKAK